MLTQAPKNQQLIPSLKSILSKTKTELTLLLSDLELTTLQEEIGGQARMLGSIFRGPSDSPFEDASIEKPSKIDNLYKRLGLRDFENNKAEIIKAFRKMAIMWHPDHNQNHAQEANTEFRTILEAYEILKDDAYRAKYDTKLKQQNNQEKPKPGNPYNENNNGPHPKPGSSSGNSRPNTSSGYPNNTKPGSNGRKEKKQYSDIDSVLTLEQLSKLDILDKLISEGLIRWNKNKTTNMRMSENCPDCECIHDSYIDNLSYNNKKSHINRMGAHCLFEHGSRGLLKYLVSSKMTRSYLEGFGVIEEIFKNLEIK